MYYQANNKHAVGSGSVIIPVAGSRLLVVKILVKSQLSSVFFASNPLPFSL